MRNIRRLVESLKRLVEGDERPPDGLTAHATYELRVGGEYSRRFETKFKERGTEKFRIGFKKLLKKQGYVNGMVYLESFTADYLDSSGITTIRFEVTFTGVPPEGGGSEGEIAKLLRQTPGIVEQAAFSQMKSPEDATVKATLVDHGLTF